MKIIDTTLRDGQQSPTVANRKIQTFSLEERKKLIEASIKVGVRHFEFFSPIVNAYEGHCVRQLITWINSLNETRNSLDKIYAICHCRCNEADIKAAIDAGFHGLNLFFGTSPHSINATHGKSFNQVVSRASHIISKLRKNHPNLYIRFSCEDAFRTPIDDILHILKKICEDIDTFGIPDTVGTADSQKINELVKRIRGVSDVDLECHFHNDLGMATSNTVAAVNAGVKYVSASVWGLAERTGITSISQIILNYLRTNLDSSYNPKYLYNLNRTMAEVLGVAIPISEPINVASRTHVAGVHQKAVGNSSSSYEGIEWATFGVPAGESKIGPLSGYSAVKKFVAEKYRVNLSDEEAREVVFRFKQDFGKNKEELNEVLFDNSIKAYFGK